MNLKRAILFLLLAAFIMPSIVMAQTPEPITARFLVNKVFTDGNPGKVQVTLTCNTGSPLTQSAMISFGDPVAFVVEEMLIVDDPLGATTCNIIETGVTGSTVGYLTVYDALGGVESIISCEFSARSALDNLDLINECDIVNTPAPVDVDVTKV